MGGPNREKYRKLISGGGGGKFIWHLKVVSDDQVFVFVIKVS